MTTPDPDSDDLSTLLRDLRRAAGLTLDGLAERVGMSKRQLQRYEKGEWVPPVEAAQRLAEAVHAKPALRRRLVQLARDAEEGVVSRAQLMRRAGGIGGTQDRLRRVEAASRLVRSFANQLVPGLLQSPAYMRAVFDSVGWPAPEAEKAVAARRARLEQALEVGPRQYVQVATEGGLMWNIGGPAVMVEQIEHITRLIAEAPSHFRIGVIPSTRPSGVVAMGSFDLYDTRVAVVGNDVATLWMSNRRDAVEYGKHFEKLSALADFGEAALPTLQRVADRYRQIAAS